MQGHPVKGNGTRKKTAHVNISRSGHHYSEGAYQNSQQGDGPDPSVQPVYLPVKVEQGCELCCSKIVPFGTKGLEACTAKL